MRKTLLSAVAAVTSAAFVVAGCLPAVAKDAAPPEPVSKVLVFVEENHSLAQMKSGMPYAYSLATRYGYASNYVANAHPSLPNYIAVAAGTNYGITDDRDPAAHPLTGRSVFGQAIAAGKTAATYADGMASNCQSTKGESYVPRHNPWTYFVDERALCEKFDLPLDGIDSPITDGTLPNVGMVIPNLDHDAHDGSLGTADKWFKDWMAKIVAGPDWESGRLAIVLTADEDDRHADNKVLTIMIHRSQSGNVVTTPLTHFSLTRLFGEVTGTKPLTSGATAPSMAAAFGLPVASQVPAPTAKVAPPEPINAGHRAPLIA